MINSSFHATVIFHHCQPSLICIICKEKYSDYKLPAVTCWLNGISTNSGTFRGITSQTVQNPSSRPWGSSVICGPGGPDCSYWLGNSDLVEYQHLGEGTSLLPCRKECESVQRGSPLRVERGNIFGEMALVTVYINHGAQNTENWPRWK